MGRLFLCRGCVLESGWRGNFRIHDQSAHRALLHAGIEHDGGARARCALRCLRHARTGTDAVLSAGDEAGTQVEGTTDLVCLLGHQYRFDVGDRLEPVAGWFDANLSIRVSGLLVGAEFRVHANRTDADSALDANDRRLNICPRRNLVRLLRAQFDVATSCQKGSNRSDKHSGGRGRLRGSCKIQQTQPRPCEELKGNSRTTGENCLMMYDQLLAPRQALCVSLKSDQPLYRQSLPTPEGQQ